MVQFDKLQLVYITGYSLNFRFNANVKKIRIIGRQKQQTKCEWFFSYTYLELEQCLTYQVSFIINHFSDATFPKHATAVSIKIATL